MSSNSNLVYFIYSEMQINEDRKVAQSIGRSFNIGDVYIGSTPKKYSKIVKERDFGAMLKQYPDSKIVTQGELEKIKYTPAEMS